VFYLALISPFGGFFKYPFPVFGFMILAVVFFYQENFVQTKVNIVIAFLAAALAILYENHFLRDNMFISQMVFNHLPLLWIGVLIGYILLNLKKSSSLAKIALPYFIIAIIGFQVNISRVQAKAPYPTKYHYGQQGFDETVNYLKAKTRKDEVIWSMKDIGYYVNNRYIENYGFFFDKSLNAELERLTKEGKVRYYVATTGIGEDRVDYYLEIMKILEKNTELDANFGNFVIYKAK